MFFLDFPIVLFYNQSNYLVFSGAKINVVKLQVQRPVMKAVVLTSLRTSEHCHRWIGNIELGLVAEDIGYRI